MMSSAPSRISNYEAWEDAVTIRPDWRSLRSGLEALDLVPQRAVLGLVGGPYLLLRHFAEFLDIGFHYSHAERLQLRLGLGALDLVPQRAVLGLVGGPYLLLRHFAEFLDIGFHYSHAERLQLRLGL